MGLALASKKFAYGGLGGKFGSAGPPASRFRDLLCQHFKALKRPGISEHPLKRKSRSMRQSAGGKKGDGHADHLLNSLFNLLRAKRLNFFERYRFVLGLKQLGFKSHAVQSFIFFFFISSIVISSSAGTFQYYFCSNPYKRKPNADSLHICGFSFQALNFLEHSSQENLL